MFETLIGLYLLASSEFTKPSTETLLKRTKRVVGGDFASIDQMPYVVNIRRNGVFQCGGSLITPACVLTAAHCVKTGKPKDFVVRAGVTYLHNTNNSRRVNKIFVPTVYDNKTLNFDVAVFRLESAFISPNIETIQMATKLPGVGDRVIVSGWGLTSETATHPSNQLRTININVFSQTHCRNLYKNYRNVTDNMFCASVPGLKDACSADSGGPAVANGKLVGVVSWGRRSECARPSSPGVYVNIPAVKLWIDKIVEQACL